MTIRIVIAEDQSMVLGALAALLDLEDDLSVVGKASDGRKALELLQEVEADILVSDIEMPNLSGLDLATEIKQAGLPVKVLILTTFARPGYLRRAMDAGVLGYLLKDAPSEDLARAIRRVHQGLRVIDPELAIDAWSETNPLTQRERDVLRLAGEGAGGKEIAEQLHLSQGTVRNYLSEAIGKLDAANRVEAARIARQKGWL